MTTQTRIKVSAIQDPSPSNTVTVQKQLKESAEVAQRLRGDPGDSYVRVSELTQGGLWKLVNGVLVPNNVAASGSIVVADSITGAGTAASPVELVGDSASPGNSQLYGTNGSGTKGWYAQPAAGSSTLAGLTDVLISAPANGQVLTYVSGASKWENQAATGGSGNITPDTHPSSPTAWDDEFEFGVTIDTTGARRGGANAWSVLNTPTGSTNAVATGALTLNFATPTNVVNYYVVGQSVPVGAWTFVAKLSSFISITNPTPSGVGDAGLAVYNSGNGHLATCTQQNNGTSFGWIKVIGARQLASFTSFNANLGSSFNIAGHTSVTNTTDTLYSPVGGYVQIAYDGTSNLTLSWSPVGIPGTFVVLATTTVAAYLTAMTHICLIVGVTATGSSNDAYVAAFDWFRRTV